MSLNAGCRYEETIDGRGQGRTVVEYLATRYTHTGAEEWRHRIESEGVRVDGLVVSPETLLQRGQRLVWSRPPWEEPEAPLGFAVLYEDAELIAVAKPSGLPTLPGASFLEHTLLHLVRQRAPLASPVHRLGRGTSGIVLFGKTPQACASVSMSWGSEDVVKIYRALVQGRVSQDAFEIAAPIGPVRHEVLGTVHAHSSAGKAARSHVRVLERREHTSVVEVRIDTGRPHQIRIHMASAGHPLVGDPLYVSGGGIRAEGAAVPGDLGYLLHAERLNLPHPSGAALSIYCAPPPRLRLGHAP
jgi:23S rRNA pseudouridine1911/1915/1917 synthase